MAAASQACHDQSPENVASHRLLRLTWLLLHIAVMPVQSPLSRRKPCVPRCWEALRTTQNAVVPTRLAVCIGMHACMILSSYKSVSLSWRPGVIRIMQNAVSEVQISVGAEAIQRVLDVQLGKAVLGKASRLIPQ